MSCAGRQRAAEERVSSKDTAPETPKPDNVVVRYLKETRAELRKVSWPTRQQATNLTLIVLAVTVAMAIFLGTIDFIFAAIIKLLVS
jgi:preprotein translocase subunit SecE